MADLGINWAVLGHILLGAIIGIPLGFLIGHPGYENDTTQRKEKTWDSSERS